MVLAREPERRAWEYRLLGWSLGRNAQELGMTKEGVRKALLRYYDDELDDELRRGAALAKLEDLDRIDRMTGVYLPLALEGDVASAMLILKFAERRAKYFNLDDKLPPGADERVGLPIAFVDRLREVAASRMVADRSG